MFRDVKCLRVQGFTAEGLEAGGWKSGQGWRLGSRVPGRGSCSGPGVWLCGAVVHLEVWIWGPWSSSGVFSHLNTGEYTRENFLQTGFPRTFPLGPIEVITSCGTTFSEK